MRRRKTTPDITVNTVITPERLKFLEQVAMGEGALHVSDVLEIVSSHKELQRENESLGRLLNAANKILLSYKKERGYETWPDISQS